MLVLLTRQGLVSVLTHWSGSICGSDKIGCGRFMFSLILWCSRSVEIDRSQDVRCASLPMLVRFSHVVLLCSKELYTCCFVQGVWYVDPDSVLATDSFASVNAIFSHRCHSFHIFFNLVSCSYAGELGCAWDECLFVRID